MKAMILAAGMGARLRPLTGAVPKALVPVGGAPLLERAARRLLAAGASALVVNVHHQAGQVEAFCADLSRRLGASIAVSREDAELLGTGGGLKKAAPLLAGGGPFLVHNVDVVGDLDLRALMAAHRAGGALATLACRVRASGRALLFDRAGLLRGRAEPGRVEWADGSADVVWRLGFDGISALSPEFLDLIEENGSFSILKPLLRLAGAGRVVRLFRSDRWAWFDAGSIEKLAAAERWIARG